MWELVPRLLADRRYLVLATVDSVGLHVGVLEIAAAIGLLVPRLCGLAALGGTAWMTGTTLTNIFLIAAHHGCPSACSW